MTAGGGPRPIEAAELGALLADLIPIGRDDAGATTRLAWTDEDEQAAAWFARRAAAIGRTLERDPAGNLWACPDAPPPWWAVGSHLDSVRGGGRFDGALGVAAGFAVAERLPVAVVSFADEEGARFNTPTFGSRALTGVLDLGVLDRVDRDGIRLADAMRAAGVDPARIGDAPDWLSRLRGFVELHIDQTTELQGAGIPAGVVRGLASRMRLRADIEGRADHSGTTPPADRRDALAAAARLIVAALDRSGDGLVATASRIEVEPNALTTVPAHASVWLDARSPDPERVDAWRAELEALDVGLPVALSLESRSAGCEFDPRLRERLVALSEALGARAPEMECYAGHDAGLIAARLPAAMALVRNETGVSHSPAEHVDLEDAAFGAELVLRLLRELPA